MTRSDLQRIRQRAARQDFDASDPSASDAMLDEIGAVYRSPAEDDPAARDEVIAWIVRLLRAHGR